MRVSLVFYGVVILLATSILGWRHFSASGPADTSWPPKGPVTYKAAAARPEGHLTYPGARLWQHLGGDEVSSGFGQTSGSAGAILLSDDPADKVRAWYKDWLLARGWSVVWSGGGDTSVALTKDQYSRGTRENFLLYVDDPAKLAATIGDQAPHAHTVFESRYIVRRYTGSH
jgi:hypothetical protein